MRITLLDIIAKINSNNYGSGPQARHIASHHSDISVRSGPWNAYVGRPLGQAGCIEIRDRDGRKYDIDRVCPRGKRIANEQNCFGLGYPAGAGSVSVQVFLSPSASVVSPGCSLNPISASERYIADEIGMSPTTRSITSTAISVMSNAIAAFQIARVLTPTFPIFCNQLDAN